MNDKGDYRTIQQIVRAVVANLNFIKGEALRLLRTNSSQFTFEENMGNLKTRLQNRESNKSHWAVLSCGTDYKRSRVVLTFWFVY